MNVGQRADGALEGRAFGGGLPQDHDDVIRVPLPDGLHHPGRPLVEAAVGIHRLQA